MRDDEWYEGRGGGPAKAERERLREAVGLVLGLAFVAAIVGFYSCGARAGEAEVTIPLHVHEEGRTSIRLMPGKCVDAMSTMIIAAAASDYLERFRAIESTWLVPGGGTAEYAGCWMELSAQEAGADEAVLVLVFSDGHRGMIRKSDFLKKAKGGGT